MAGDGALAKHGLAGPESARRSCLTPLLLFGGAFAWGLTMLASMLVYESLRIGMNTFHLGLLALVFTCGGMIGWLTAVPIAWRLTRGRHAETRLAAYLFGLMLSTVSFTAFLFSMHYRIFYSQWHDPFGTIGWTFELLETGASSVYQFLVLGLPHFLPIAFPALFLASGWLVKAMR